MQIMLVFHPLIQAINKHNRRVQSKSISISDISFRGSDFRLAIELKTKEGSTWSDQIPKDNNDDDHYLTYIKMKDNFSEADSYMWYRNRGNQLYLDGCFVLAIRCFTHCIEIKRDIAVPYTNRAACYLRAFEVSNICILISFQ